MVRVIVLPGIDDKTTTTLKKMRPAPSYYVILATTDRLTELFNQVCLVLYLPVYLSINYSKRMMVNAVRYLGNDANLSAS